MDAAVEHVEQRDRQLNRPPVRRGSATAGPRVGRRGAGHRERCREHRVGAETRLLARAVEREQRPIDGGLVVRVAAAHMRRSRL